MRAAAEETQFLAPAIRPDEDDLEQSLRPRRLDEFVGQERVKEQLAIALEDTARFQAIPGIGKKTAQRVVLELKEKLGAVAEVAEPTALSPKPHLVAREALVELGYTLAEAEEALAGTDPDAPPEERVREALKKAA